jgi:hypothetical protein
MRLAVRENEFKQNAADMVSPKRRAIPIAL